MTTLRLLIKPTLFTAGVCGTCFCGAAICQYENRKQPIYKDWTIPYQRHKYSDFRQKINDWANSLTTGDKLAAGTIFINVLVFGAWRIKSMQLLMHQYFINQASTTTPVRLSSLILSNFSHMTKLHLACNMIALYSFTNISNSLLGPEQLVGLYIGAGAVSSLTSLAYRFALGRTAYSLGASGGLLGVVSYTCLARPEDLKLLVFFIPMSAGLAIKCIIGLDVVGVICRWQFLDHAAHLGGTLAGGWYAWYGEKLFWQYRNRIVDKWIEFKKSAWNFFITKVNYFIFIIRTTNKEIMLKKFIQIFATLDIYSAIERCLLWKWESSSKIDAAALIAISPVCGWTQTQDLQG